MLPQTQMLVRGPTQKPLASQNLGPKLQVEPFFSRGVDSQSYKKLCLLSQRVLLAPRHLRKLGGRAFEDALELGFGEIPLQAHVWRTRGPQHRSEQRRDVLPAPQ